MVIGKMIILHTLESLHKYFYLSGILNEALLSNRINIDTLKQYFIFFVEIFIHLYNAYWSYPSSITSLKLNHSTLHCQFRCY